MKIRLKKYLLSILFVMLCVSCCVSFAIIEKSVKAMSETEADTIYEENEFDYDILDGASGSCYPNDEISPLVVSNGYCDDGTNTHGPGRELGGEDILSRGCRNYMSNGFSYGSKDIAYWINMESINQITNTTHRQKVLSDIRQQTEMWNQACMYDGTGQIVYIIDLFLWSESEYLSSYDSTACIQYKDNSGNWVTILDLLNEIELSEDRLFPETYTIVLPEKTKEFRIYCTTAKIGNMNKGRLCIGDMSIYLEGK